MIADFPISSEDARLLLLLETTGSVRNAASALKRDVSVVTRQIARIAEDHGLAEKIAGQWRVSEAGRRLNAWTQDAMLGQKRALARKASLRISTTREFAARVLASAIPELFPEHEADVTIHCCDGDVEATLLSGEADVGLNCGRPRDPLIRFQRLLPEPFVLAAAPTLAKKAPTLDALRALPCLQYTRLSTARALGLESELPRMRAVFNDLGAMRAAAVAGLGWGLFPRYVVAQELANEALREIRLRGVSPEPEQFGIWWLRDRAAIEPWVERLAGWLKKQKL